MTVALRTTDQQLAAGNLEGHKQRDEAVSSILVGAAAEAVLAHGELPLA